MNAWQKLLAASQLAAGTAWQLISNPKLGTGGGVIVNDGIAIELADNSIQIEVTPMQIEVEVSSAEVIAEVQDQTIVVELNTTPIEVEVTQ